MSADAKKPAAPKKADDKKAEEKNPAAKKEKGAGGKMGRVKRSIVPFLLGALTGVGGLFGYEYVSGTGNLSIMQHLQGDSTAVAAPDSAAKPAGPAADTLAALAVDSMPSVAIDTTGMLAADSAVAFDTPV